MPEWLPAVTTHRKNLSFKKGELIFHEGEAVKGIYFVYQGTVKVHKKWGSEKELIIRFARQGSLFGHRGLGQDHHYPISATALSPVEACYIDLDFFQASLKVNQGLSQGLLQFFADELQKSERKMRDLAHMQVKGRVAQALLQLREDFGVTPDGYIGLTLSRQDLASLVGATYETVFRIINELAQEKLILVDGKDIAIADAIKLTDYTKE
ncbi:transcriptional regulator [Puia dinghuensis]|uniref:Transcriptional regulator n=2 Tax=Puia dinghuensis TaxID=1792502 RepID=A0A8J2XR65_9BACT|nr:transcriptional regulator [Puia dinghuensis]